MRVVQAVKKPSRHRSLHWPYLVVQYTDKIFLYSMLFMICSVFKEHNWWTSGFCRSTTVAYFLQAISMRSFKIWLMITYIKLYILVSISLTVELRDHYGVRKKEISSFFFSRQLLMQLSVQTCIMWNWSRSQRFEWLYCKVRGRKIIEVFSALMLAFTRLPCGRDVYECSVIKLWIV